MLHARISHLAAASGAALLTFIAGSVQAAGLPADIQAIVRDRYGADARYFAGEISLNGDSTLETLVYVVGAKACGTGGCPTLVFTSRDGHHVLVSTISPTHPPIGAATSGSAGWRNLVVRIAGGGIKPADVELMFDGKHYPENPTLATPVVRPAKPGDATVVIPVFKTLDAATPLDPPPAKSDGKP